MVLVGELEVLIALLDLVELASHLLVQRAQVLAVLIEALELLCQAVPLLLQLLNHRQLLSQLLVLPVQMLVNLLLVPYALPEGHDLLLELGDFPLRRLFLTAIFGALLANYRIELDVLPLEQFVMPLKLIVLVLKVRLVLQRFLVIVV